MSNLNHSIRNEYTLPNLVRRILFSWLLAVLIEYLVLPRELRDLASLNGLGQMSLPRILVIGSVSFFVLCGLSYFVCTQLFERWGILAVFMALTITACCTSASVPFLIGCLCVIFVLFAFGVWGWENKSEPNVVAGGSRRQYIWIIVGFSAAICLFICCWTLGRVYSFRAPCYDFGIFSQMYYYMKETGLPLTTVERDTLMSHFAVHVSPIYYLLLPVYCLFPMPATLQISQAVILTSAVIPLWKLGKHFGLNGVQRMLICVVLLLYPAYSGGASYDIHENCFLTPLLLWMLYGIFIQSTGLVSITAILTLSVKEDAAIYVAVVGLWLVIKTLLRFPKKNQRDLLTGAALFVFSLCWFFAATGFLAHNGDGIMSYRYENYMYDGSASLITVIKSVILNPLKVIYECTDPEKALFIAMTMLPLLCLPVLTRRYERYILMIPYLLVNLMSDYRYQHDIFFQYSFGSIALLLFLTVINLSDIKQTGKRTNALIASAVIAAVCFAVVVMPKAIQYPAQAIQNYAQYEQMRDTLDTIPEDASVSATTYYATYLSQRKTLYTIQYGSIDHILSTQYIVFDPSLDEFAQFKYIGKHSEYENFIVLLEKNGYEKSDDSNGNLVIYYRDRS